MFITLLIARNDEEGNTWKGCASRKLSTNHVVKEEADS